MKQLASCLAVDLCPLSNISDTVRMELDQMLAKTRIDSTPYDHTELSTPSSAAIGHLLYPNNPWIQRRK